MIQPILQNRPGSPIQLVYYLVLGDELDEAAISLIIVKLVQIITLAAEERAVLVIPDYSTASPSSKYIETALRQAEFSGPVINVGQEDQIACDSDGFGQTYQSAGAHRPRGVLLSKATHSFQVAPGTMTHSILAARLAKVLGGGVDVEGDPGEVVRPEQEVVALVAGGDASTLSHMAELAREGIPMIILEGSGGLCDRLPRAYAQRAAPAFSAQEASRQLCLEGGLSKGTDRLGRCARAVLEEGGLTLLPLSHPTSAFQRALAAAKRRDTALVLALLQLREYAASARAMDRPARVLLVLKIAISFVMTLLAAIQSQSGDAAAAVAAEVRQAAYVANQTLAQAASRGPVLHYIVVVLPAIFTLIVSLARSERPKYLAACYGAAQVRARARARVWGIYIQAPRVVQGVSQMYRYCTQTGAYNIMYIPA
jgi:hypothetical protein